MGAIYAVFEINMLLVSPVCVWYFFDVCVRVRLVIVIFFLDVSGTVVGEANLGL